MLFRSGRLRAADVPDAVSVRKWSGAGPLAGLSLIHIFYDLIAKKRDGGTHSREELEAIVNGFVSGDVYKRQVYAHCLSLTVSAGQTVRQGQLIGYLGSTGRSTGNHCHFEIRLNGSYIPPQNVFPGKK